ncbi:MAG: hypothetical protein FJ012_06505 [Chloroflexi bacterium]|nr:hypothetical protein [Chloroflexota bacterium]
MEFVVPQSLKLEHEELHAELTEATRAGGMVGKAAKAVEKVLHTHFAREEEYSLPPLGLLRLLAEGRITADMRAVILMTNRLKADLGQMLEEHKAIVDALRSLSEASQKENKTRYVQFADRLILHAQTEEEVLYPAAILIGEYLKLKSAR